MKPTPEQLHILQHSLGLDQYGKGNAYRNHFVTGPGTDDYPHCQELVTAGYMLEHPRSTLSGGDPVFTVTDAGKNAVTAYSPKPPRLTRSKQRYQQWLDADAPVPFRQWLGIK